MTKDGFSGLLPIRNRPLFNRELVLKLKQKSSQIFINYLGGTWEPQCLWNHVPLILYIYA